MLSKGGAVLGKPDSTKGQAILELALVLPILLLLLFGIVEFGRIFNASIRDRFTN